MELSQLLAMTPEEYEVYSVSGYMMQELHTGSIILEELSDFSQTSFEKLLKAAEGLVDQGYIMMETTPKGLHIIR